MFVESNPLEHSTSLTLAQVTQCQAIHARSLFPCQDTPDVKSTYEFKIKSPLPVIASGIPAEIETRDLGDGTKIYVYKQDVPIPSYLFALASGDIVQASIGPRSIVATGPDGLDAAKWELEESTEKFIQTVEKIVFPYVWGIYNVLVLPPSFPYGRQFLSLFFHLQKFNIDLSPRRVLLIPETTSGGMENPIYTVCPLQARTTILWWKRFVG